MVGNPTLRKAEKSILQASEKNLAVKELSVVRCLQVQTSLIIHRYPSDTLRELVRSVNSTFQHQA
jgi:hypothetical protein